MGKKKTYLIPNKHPSPIFILNQFPYFSIGEVHSEVEIAHPKLQIEKGKKRKTDGDKG